MYEEYKGYEFYIMTEKIDPLPGPEEDYHFAAKPVFKKTPNGKPIKANSGELGEVWGTTRKDAENTAIESVKKWIDKQKE